MNQCRSDRGKQPRVIRRSKGKYGFPTSKFAFFYENCRLRQRTKTRRETDSEEAMHFVLAQGDVFLPLPWSGED